MRFILLVLVLSSLSEGRRKRRRDYKGEVPVKLAVNIKHF